MGQISCLSLFLISKEGHVDGICFHTMVSFNDFCHLIYLRDLKFEEHLNYELLPS